MKTIALTYAGKRRNALGRVWHLFFDDKGKEYTFLGSFKWVYIGHTYAAEQNKDGLTISVQPKEIESAPRPDEDTIDKWRATQSVQEIEAREMKLRERFDKMKDLLEEIPRIKKVMRGLHGGDQYTFVQWLWGEIDRENRERMNRELNAVLSKKIRRIEKRVNKKVVK